MRKKVEQRLAEVDLIVENLHEKHETLETMNQDLTKRNNYLEDHMSNMRKEAQEDLLNAQLAQVNQRTKRKGSHDISASDDLMQFEWQEDYEKSKKENIRLRDEIEVMKKRYMVLRNEKISLESHVSACQSLE